MIKKTGLKTDCASGVRRALRGRFDPGGSNAEFRIVIYTCPWRAGSRISSSGAVLKSRWPSCAPRPHELCGLCGRKAALNQTHALVTVCP